MTEVSMFVTMYFVNAIGATVTFITVPIDGIVVSVMSQVTGISRSYRCISRIPHMQKRLTVIISTKP